MEELFPNSVIMIAGIALVAILFIGLVFARLYKRATKNMAYVRTGGGGDKVIKDGGGIVIPVIQEVTPVNLETLRLEVSRRNDEAIITKDRIRVDVEAMFYLRVRGEDSSIKLAAQTLGRRTLNPQELKELVEGKFVDALRAVAAKMNIEELHEDRKKFVLEVQDTLTEGLAQNGLELENVSLTTLDQSSLDNMRADANAFDAEGMTKVTEIIQRNREKQNELARVTDVKVEQQNLRAAREKEQIREETEKATLAADEHIALATQQQLASIAEAEHQSKERSEQARIAQELKIDQADIDKKRQVELADQKAAIEVATESKAKSIAEAEASEERAKAVAAEESVVTAREGKIAERKKLVALIKASEDEETKALAITVEAEANKAAAENNAASIITLADANERQYAVEAEGKRVLHEAENALSSEIVRMRLQLATIQALPVLMEHLVAPISNIDRISIVEAGGLLGGNGHGPQSNGNGSGNLMDDLFSGLTRYQLQLPVLQNLLKAAGINDLTPEGITAGLAKLDSVSEDTEDPEDQGASEIE